MKRLIALFLAAVFLSGMLMVGSAHALTIKIGGNQFLIDGYSYADLQTGQLRGVFSVAEIKQWDEVNNVFAANPYWKKGQDDEYLNIRFGGLDTRLATTGPGSFGYLEGGWAQIWLASGTDPFEADLANIGTGYNIGEFATNMQSGQLWLDLEFAPGGVLDYQIADGGTYNPPAIASDTMQILSGGTAFNVTTSYLNVIGGSKAGTFDSDFFFDKYDIFLEGSNFASTHPGGWNFSAQSQSGQVVAVPEPGTILLLGAGLLGLAGVVRMRRRNS
ncbi:PEP-CTERM sorting domain-containing protein [Desulfonatronum thioautotrophicum]|uniref:PEP-CTERM sorting domain-containing protein n=1 Tax=Desulfonatronum thioautotrophicum TaxID=617001 RepID=UPI0005EAD7EF|nr:PEP-CTERM sorting domain-containing protein [Desulfonatronum thioautotrophicum]